MRYLITVTVLVLGLTGCRKHHEAPPARTFRMGMQNSAPRFDSFDLLIQSLNLWTPYADAAMMSYEVPWDSLISGEDPVHYIQQNFSSLAEYYRSRNFKIWVYIDPQNGLNRGADADQLVAFGKSIAQEDMQAIYVRYAFLMDSLIHPDHLGLALETNLIRLSSPDSIYQGVVHAANEAASQIRAADSNVKLSVSIQADVAWGKLQGTGTYEGISRDITDFHFVDEFGISSYPYFVFGDPTDVPDDYYSRLATDASLPVFVSEGGWTSESFSGPSNNISSTPEKQAAYIRRQADLLNRAKATALFQLTFTDIDLTSLPPGVNPTINYFAYLGLVDVNLAARPSFAEWKAIFAREFTGQ